MSSPSPTTTYSDSFGGQSTLREGLRNPLAPEAWAVLHETWAQGRKVLLIIGAGVSRDANVPPMSALFLNLQKRVNEIRDAKHDFWQRGSINKDPQLRRHCELRLDELHTQLTGLAIGCAERAMASMALGSLQRAGSLPATGQLDEILHLLWLQFTQDFIDRKISPSGDTLPVAPPEPRLYTPFHKLAAEWASTRKAYVVSLNFDGLTFRALQKHLSTSSRVAVVVSRPDELTRYFTGASAKDSDKATDKGGIVPIIKVWGDVFHAVCKNSQCPQGEIKIPAFDLDSEYSDTLSATCPKCNGAVEVLPPTSRLHECPVCHSARQLQIFFTGYEQKEKATADLMTELYKFVAPEIGCVVTAGFSGLWDEALMDFLCVVGTDLKREQKNRIPLYQNGASPLPIWINIDCDSHPPLNQAVASRGVGGDAFLHVYQTALKFAEARTEPPDTSQQEMPRHSGKRMEDGFWEELTRTGDRDETTVLLPGTYNNIESQEFALFGRLRQLGIKTRIAAGRGQKPTAEADRKHNRLRHSIGAAHISIYWYRHLAEGAARLGLLTKSDTERLASTVLFATFHHDIGHLPFSHLTEEVFAEVHWTLEEWGNPFRHDEPVLASCAEPFRAAIWKATDTAAALMTVVPAVFRGWIESAIQGRSGHHWVDAILNSPLDADKLDYVFRDCYYLHQGIHLPVDPDERIAWLRDFISHTELLPSGLVALAGPAGEKAREFLEERSWLYRHQYFDPGYRVVERLGVGVILHWLLYYVPEELVTPDAIGKIQEGLAVIGDTSQLKGAAARKLLWRALAELTREDEGEPELLQALTGKLQNDSPKGLPPSPRVKEWAAACARVFKRAFDHEAWSHAGDLLENIVRDCAVSCSEMIYVRFTELATIREIVRELETHRPFSALFDIAVIPSTLSYPSRRRLTRVAGRSVIGECFVVSDVDPSRWARTTGRWVPLSESAFGQRDKDRWVQVMAISPWPDDPSVPYSLDRFRERCRYADVEVRDVNPENAP